MASPGLQLLRGRVHTNTDTDTDTDTDTQTDTQTDTHTIVNRHAT
jgi:hypothetical protein